MTIQGTVCYIKKDGKVLLIRKSKELFGGGKWNVPGGKLRAGEDPEQCAIREVFEETGLKISNLKEHGVLDFYFGYKDNPDWAVHVFSTESFHGKLKPSREGILKWTNIEGIPYDEMWEDDRYWVPLLIKGKFFKAEFYFDVDAKRLLNYKIEESKPSIKN